MSVRVDREHAGQRLDVLVGGFAAVGSRAEAQRLIADGRVEVDGSPGRKRDLIPAGALVTVRPHPAPSTELHAEDVPFTVRYEDEHLLVVDKPAGVVVHPARGHNTGTLVHGLVAHEAAGGDDPTRPGIVHRLDRDTSGLLVVARSPRTHRRLQRMLRDRLVDRRYLALAHGDPPPAMTIDRPIARHPRDRTRMAVRADGREAVTHVIVRERLPGMALCEVRLETGRTHQIRVHLDSVGHPVVGDPVYGRRPQALGLRRQFLHAWRLSFPHPIVEGQVVEVTCELPADLAAALQIARGGGPPR